MSHLDEGVIHALLDGEIPSAELPPIQAHLGACAECRARLAEEQELLATSDRLIELLEVPTAVKPVAPRRSTGVQRRWPRNVAWAATLVLAAGLGYSARGSVRLAQEEKAAAPDTVFVRSEAPAAPAEQPPALLDGLQNAAKAGRRSSPAIGSTRTDEPSKPAIREMARAGEIPERRVAADSVASAKLAAGAGVAAASPPVQRVESSSTPPAASLPPTGQLGSAKTMRPEPMRLGERVAASADAVAAKLTATSPITLPDAVRRLGGSLRLIEGLIPDRLEALGPAVRVVYLTGFGELVLSQVLENVKVRHTLIAPPGFPADSLERLRALVRE